MNTKEGLLLLEKDQLVDLLIASNDEREKLVEKYQDSDKCVAELEGVVDAVKELLFTELRYTNQSNGDLISMANSAREILHSLRMKREREKMREEIPF